MQDLIITPTFVLNVNSERTKLGLSPISESQIKALQITLKYNALNNEQQFFEYLLAIAGEDNTLDWNDDPFNKSINNDS